jgi:hypothetical protein
VFTCERCGEEFGYEDPAYDVTFGFVYPEGSPIRNLLDADIGLFHGRCLNLPERQNDCPCRLASTPSSSADVFDQIDCT